MKFVKRNFAYLVKYTIFNYTVEPLLTKDSRYEISNLRNVFL